MSTFKVMFRERLNVARRLSRPLKRREIQIILPPEICRAFERTPHLYDSPPYYYKQSYKTRQRRLTSFRRTNIEDRKRGERRRRKIRLSSRDPLRCVLSALTTGTGYTIVFFCWSSRSSYQSRSGVFFLLLR